MSDTESFAISGLMSRWGFSNWVFFFFPDELLMIDVGSNASVKAGVWAGISAGLGIDLPVDVKYGPKASANQGLQAWSEELRAKAKKVVSMKDDDIRVVRWHLNMMAHELFVVGADGTSSKFSMMNRDQAAKTLKPLRQRFGTRAKVVKTRTYRLLERYAPALL